MSKTLSDSRSRSCADVSQTSSTASKSINHGMRRSGSLLAMSATPGASMSGMRARSSASRRRSNSSRSLRVGLHPDDRFVPTRNSSQTSLSQFMMRQGDAPVGDENDSPRTQENKKNISKAILGVGADDKRRIFAFRKAVPPAAEGKPGEGYLNPANSLFVNASQRSRGGPKRAERYVPSQPSRVLDAPSIVNDFYLNVMDWGSHNVLAVALGGCVYLWNASSGDIEELLDLDDENKYVSSLRWLPGGSVIAVGTSEAEVQLWDPVAKKRMRRMGGHTGRVGALAWNTWLLASGNRAGGLHYSDVRQGNHLLHQMQPHEQEICGLEWNPDYKYLASGANDNRLLIWSTPLRSTGHDAQEMRQPISSEPLHTFTQHMGAVKALSFCPWHPTLLASGGGTADRTIKLWNVATGKLIKSVDTGSQVAGIVWSERYREIASAHGFTKNEIALWKYPSMEKLRELTGHTDRILSLAVNPDMTTVVSASGDETARLWDLWPALSSDHERVGKDSSSGGLGSKDSGRSKTSGMRKQTSDLDLVNCSDTFSRMTLR